MGSYEKLIQNGNAYLNLSDYENIEKDFQQAVIYISSSCIFLSCMLYLFSTYDGNKPEVIRWHVPAAAEESAQNPLMTVLFRREFPAGVRLL